MDTLPSPALAGLIDSIHTPIGEGAWLNTIDVDSAKCGPIGSLEPGRVVVLDVVRGRIDHDTKLAMTIYLEANGMLNDDEVGIAQALSVALIAAEMDRQVAGASMAGPLAETIRDCTDSWELDQYEVAGAIRVAEAAKAPWLRSFRVAQHRADQVIQAMHDGDLPRKPARLGYGRVRP